MENSKSTIFKREDGSRVKIEVALLGNNKEIKYKIKIFHCEANKKTFKDYTGKNLLKYQRADLSDKQKLLEEHALSCGVTKEEIDISAHNLYLSLKPKDIFFETNLS